MNTGKSGSDIFWINEISLLNVIKKNNGEKDKRDFGSNNGIYLN
jgi:hypothetical protein